MRYVGDLVEDAVSNQNVDEEVLGVGIAVSALITEDHQKIFYGEILSITGTSVDVFAKYIPYPCRLYNDADAGGYAEVSQSKGLSDAFYISLSNNIGGSVLIDHKDNGIIVSNQPGGSIYDERKHKNYYFRYGWGSSG